MNENIIKLATLGLILLLGLVFFWAFITPKSAGIKNLQQTLKRIETQINTTFGEEVVLQGGQAQNEKILLQLEAFKRQIPSERDLPHVVDEIIRQSGRGLALDYRLIEPQELLSEGKYKRLPLKLSLSCSYATFIAYLTQLSQLSVLVVVDSLALKRSAGSADQLDINLALSAFLMPAEAGEGARMPALATKPSLLANPFQIEVGSSVEGQLAVTPGAKPVWPKSRTQPGLTLQGVWQGKDLRAFINGKMLKLGDKINGYQVSQIKNKKVLLTKDGNIYTLTLK